jgi:hypothetical protein
MVQALHRSATATAAIRRVIQHSQESLRVLARRHGVDQGFVYGRWQFSLAERSVWRLYRREERDCIGSGMIAFLRQQDISRP